MIHFDMIINGQRVTEYVMLTLLVEENLETMFHPFFLNGT